MRINELLTEEEKGIIDVTKDFFKGLMGNNDDPAFEKMMLRAKIYKNNGYRVAFARKKLMKDFPKMKPVDVNRAMQKVGFEI